MRKQDEQIAEVEARPVPGELTSREKALLEALKAAGYELRTSATYGRMIVKPAA